MSSAGQAEIVHVALGDRSYDITIGTSGLAGVATALESWCQSRGVKLGARKLCLVVTDQHLAATHAAIVQRALQEAGWTSALEVLPSGEQTKSQGFVTKLYDRLVDLKADRHTPVVAVGGGVIGDLAGFVAASFARGVPFVQVPTTLLAQVDSSVGGKVGINHPRGKNLIGAFYQPLGVYLDTQVLETLPEREYRAGLAEVVKYGVILDATFYEFLEQHVAELNARDPQVLRQVVARSCRLKADVVEQDEFERSGLRAVLNYGHTFAHAFEALLGYGELLHGEAVSVGMLYASRLAERLGRVDAKFTGRQYALLEALHLPVELPASGRPTTSELLACMQLDKKNVGGQLRFVLPTRLGHVELVNVDESDVRAVLDAAI